MRSLTSIFPSLFKNRQDYILEKSLAATIHIDQVQLNLIEAIKMGSVKFQYLGSTLKGNLFCPYYEEVWLSKYGKFRLSFEDPGFMSFTYLRVNGKEVVEKPKWDKEDKYEGLKHYTDICLEIQYACPNKKVAYLKRLKDEKAI